MSQAFKEHGIAFGFGIRILFAITVLSLTPPLVSGQTITAGEVTGMVMDQSGAVVSNAIVLLKSMDTGESRTVKSNAAGAYRFTFLNPGTYQISSSIGSLRSDAGSLVVAVGQVQAVNLYTKLEGPKEVVLVSDEAPLLNADNANLIYTVSSRQMEFLPLPGGDLTAIAYAMPGAVVNNRFGAGNFSGQGVPGVSNLFTINGLDDMDPYFSVNNSGVSGLLLGANEVREASVVQNAYEGQYGRHAGAQVNYVSKSGANAYHGNLLYNYNGTTLNANDFFGNAYGLPRPHAVSNQYAAAFGGRIKRDKLFFFANTEGLRFALPGAASVNAVPSQALQLFTLKTIQPAQSPLYRKAFSAFDSAPGRERAIAVTNGNGLLQDSTGRLGCGALAGIPAGSGGVFGEDVFCSEAFAIYDTRQTSEWLLSGRVDYNVNDRQRMYFRFKTDQGVLPIFGRTLSPIFNAYSVQPAYQGQVNHTFVITPRVVNNFIGAASYSSYVAEVPDLVGALQVFPYRLAVFEGGANGSNGGMTPVGPLAAFPTGTRNGQLQIIDDLSYHKGNHLLKVGVNYLYNREADLQYSMFVDSGRFNLFGLDEFASGTLNASNGSNYTQNFPVTPVIHLRLHNLGFYIQDQWAVMPNLKLTATVRFERTANPYCRENCFTRFFEPFPEAAKGADIPYNQSIQSGLSRAFYDVEPIIPQPRLSVAYSPRWSKDTVLRGGVGLFSDLYPAFSAGTVAGNAPNVFAPRIREGLVNTDVPGAAPFIARESAEAFQRGFAGGATLAQLGLAVAPATFGAPAYYSVPSMVRNPKSLQWNIDVQRQFGAKNVLEVRYSGNRGYDIFLINPNVNANRNPVSYPNGFAGLPAAAPDPRFRIVSQLTNNGYSNYNALNLIFRHAFGSGVQGQFGYVWSHALDSVSNGGLLRFSSFESVVGQIDPRDVRALNYSHADYDVRHNVTADFIWDIPVRFQGQLANRILGGWTVSGKVNAHSGTPFSIVNSRLAAGLSPSFGGVALAEVLASDVQTSCGSAAVDTPCFAASQFATAATQSGLGNRPRNSFRGPGYFNVDSSLYKSIPVREVARFTFGASAYNLLNHTNFASPAADVNYPGLGLITFTVGSPSSPHGHFNGPSGRTIVATGKFSF